MKKIIIIMLMFCNIGALAQYSSTTIKTPKGTYVSAETFSGTDFTSTEKNDIKNYWLNYYNNEITYVGEATKKYNCHAYAWHVIENGNQVWINTPEDNKYWVDESYTEVYDHELNLKVSFGGPCYYYNSEFGYSADWCDHSAVTASQPNNFISKWGACCIFEHSIDNCPYDSQDLHYYKLSNPVIYSATSGFLCENVQRTFTETKFTDIDLIYDWHCTSPLSAVGDDDESTYIVEGTSQNGQGSVSLSVTTPSGTTVFGYYGTVQVVSTPYLDIYCEGGDGGYAGNSYLFYVFPEGDEEIMWGVYPNGSIIEEYGINNEYALIYFASAGYKSIMANGVNTCGTGPTAYYDFQVYDNYFLSPNPASTEVTITVNNDKSVNASSSFDVSLIDAYGNLVHQKKYFGESFKIPIHNLKDGYYFVKILNGREEVIKKIVVKK